MANEIRRYDQFISGVVSDNPLLVGATTLNSPGLAGLEVVDATEQVVIVLDPLGAGNGPEIIYVTAHTVATTAATVVRGREGTSAAQHALNTPWYVAAVTSDYLSVSDTAGRPATGLYRGRKHLDTDLNTILHYDSTVPGWVATANLGAATTYTPTWVATGGAVALGNGTLTGRYFKVGRKCWVSIALNMGSTTNGAAGNYTFALPFAAANFAEQEIVGKLFSAGPFNWMGVGYIPTNATTVSPYFPTSAGDCRLLPFNQNNPGSPVILSHFTMEAGSNMILSGTYETAA